MGCVSSKLFKKGFQQDVLFGNGEEDYPNHVISLTSSTLGVLQLDKLQYQFQDQQSKLEKQSIKKECVIEVKKSSSPNRDEPEVINTWELMEGLEDQVPTVKKSPKSRGFFNLDARSPLKFFNQMGSPRKLKKFEGKENDNNKGWSNGSGRYNYSPKPVLKECNLPDTCRKSSPKLRFLRKASPIDVKCDSFRADSVTISSRRRSLGPLFDPELVKSFEKEEQIKKMVPGTPTILENFEKKCPPGGENAVVIYTTTLRGIRKTFEDCNKARSAIESHKVQIFERDISMHSAFKDELRVLMGKKEVKVPLVFVKGRLIGGADEIVKLEEEDKLGILFGDIPVAEAAVCEGCAGVRFVMCMDCNGSCKLLDEEGKKTLKCGECNENGLIQCPLCC